MSSKRRPVRVFISYTHADEAHRQRLEVHLAPLRREGLIDAWHDRLIAPGSDWEAAIDRNLSEADIVLLLVSADFVASDYCFKKELRVAMERHERGDVLIVPVFVEPADLEGLSLAKLQGLPRDGAAVSTWRNRDEAWLEVAEGIRQAIATLSTEVTRRHHVAKGHSPSDLAQLRRVLTRLYPAASDRERVVADAALRRDLIDLSGSAANAWFHVLEHAAVSGQLTQIVAIAQGDYADNTELQQIADVLGVRR